MRRDILVVAHSYYPSDPRIRKQVEVLLEAGRSVDVVCLRGPGEARVAERGRLRIRRLPVRRHRGSGLGTYLLEYAAFIVLAWGSVTVSWLRHRHRVIQTHTLPDPLIFVGLVPRLFGARLLLDMHELTPEFFGSRAGLLAGSPLLRLLRAVERASCGFAHHVITVSEPVAWRLAARGVDRDGITVVLNTAPVPAGGAEPVDPDDERPFTLIYAGLLSDLYDLSTALRALALLEARGVRDVVLRLVGEGPALPSLRAEAASLGVAERVEFEGRVAPERVPALLREAHAGLVPLAPVPYMELALPTKVFECLAAGLPVITTRLTTIRHYLGEDEACYVAPADPTELARRILELRDDPEARRAYAARGGAVARELRWQVQAERYLGVVARAGGWSLPEGRVVASAPAVAARPGS